MNEWLCVCLFACKIVCWCLRVLSCEFLLLEEFLVFRNGRRLWLRFWVLRLLRFGFVVASWCTLHCGVRWRLGYRWPRWFDWCGVWAGTCSRTARFLRAPLGWIPWVGARRLSWIYRCWAMAWVGMACRWNPRTASTTRLRNRRLSRRRRLAILRLSRILRTLARSTMRRRSCLLRALLRRARVHFVRHEASSSRSLEANPSRDLPLCSQQAP